LGALHSSDVLLLGGHESPDFIHLEALTRQALEHAVLIPSCGLPGVHNELAYRCLAETSHAGHGANAHAFTKELEGFGAVFGAQLVHAGHYA
jgi:hypothetical protein